MPSQLIFDSTSNVIRLNRITAKGTYYVSVTGTLPTGQTATANLTIFIVGNYGPPYFTQTIQTLHATSDTTVIYSLPPAVDPDQDNFDITANLGSASSFVTY